MPLALHFPKKYNYVLQLVALKTLVLKIYSNMLSTNVSLYFFLHTPLQLTKDLPLSGYYEL